jgi:hypothetical protein
LCRSAVSMFWDTSREWVRYLEKGQAGVQVGKRARRSNWVGNFTARNSLHSLYPNIGPWREFGSALGAFPAPVASWAPFIIELCLQHAGAYVLLNLEAHLMRKNRFVPTTQESHRCRPRRTRCRLGHERNLYIYILGEPSKLGYSPPPVDTPLGLPVSNVPYGQTECFWISHTNNGFVQTRTSVPTIATLSLKSPFLECGLQQLRARPIPPVSPVFKLSAHSPSSIMHATKGCRPYSAVSASGAKDVVGTNRGQQCFAVMGTRSPDI